MGRNERASRAGRRSTTEGPRRRSVAELVGDTPLLWIPDITGHGIAGFWAKLEGFNPGGMKDRAALHMVRQARERGQLRPGAVIVDSTSGTFGLGLALAGLTFGHRVHLVVDAELEPVMRWSLAARGTVLDIVDRPIPPVGGSRRAASAWRR